MAANDWLSQDEADTALGIGSSDTANDTILVALITAVSQRLDVAVGPVVARAVTDELHDGGGLTITAKLGPIYSTPGITLEEYDGTATTTLTRETFGDNQDQYGYLLEPSAEAGLYSGVIRRRSYGTDARFPAGVGNVRVSYTAGRVANTAAVPERYKQAARVTLENWWQMVRTSTAPTTPGEYVEALSIFPTFAIPNAARQLLDDVWRDGAVDLVVV